MAKQKRKARCRKQMNVTCGDCGVNEGDLHQPGCDMELCPFCGDQLLSCQCKYKKLGIDVSPGSWAYSHGLTDAQQKDWEKLLSDKGRVPFILYPLICAKCGALWPICSWFPIASGSITSKLTCVIRLSAAPVTMASSRS